jgi:hypothetical protein
VRRAAADVARRRRRAGPGGALVGTATHLLLASVPPGWLGGWREAADTDLDRCRCRGTGLPGLRGPGRHRLGAGARCAGDLLALRTAALALAVTVALGLLLVAVLQGWIRVAEHTRWVDSHAAWGLMGWVGLLVVGVAIQVLPMFYVTPAYPAPMRRWFAPAVLIGIGVASVAWIIGPTSSGRPSSVRSRWASSALP